MMADDSYSDRTRSSIALAAGTIVSHYRIISKIGVGGMGEVYLADDTELDRKVALKFLAPHLCQDEDCRTRFKREAQAAARLSHPNIITVFEVAEHQGRPFFAMEYIEGLSLRDYASRKELSIGQILEIGVQVCEGLQAAHEAGVTHRDIKPSNVVIDSRGRVRIVDFGLAAVKGATHVTKTGSTLGTVGYMSPEQVRGEDVDRRSDLFSLGVVFYEMITARAPFRKDSEAATMNAVLNDSPEPLSRFKSGVPADLERIVCRLLQKEKRLRYQTAGDLAADMKLVETSRRPLSAPFRTATRSSISRVGLPALVFVLFALILSGLKPWRLLTSPSEKAAAAPRRLAVLYLKNRGSPADEYLSYGITEDLTVDLTRIGTIGVAPMRSVMLYKDSAGELQDIARQLRVNLVLDGSLYKTGDIVRISAQLVDVTSGTNLWADRWEEKIENLPHIKEALAQSVSRALAVDTSVVRTAQIGSPETENAVAYDYYLRGKYAFEHKANEADVETAFGLFNKAVELEPMLLAARTGVAKVLMHKGQYEPAREQLTSILSDARRLGLRSDEAEVLRFLAFYHLLKSHWDEGQACAEQALRISGELGDLMGEVEALRFVIETHRIRGRFDEAFALFQRLLDLNRRLDDRAAEARSLGSMGNVYFEKGEYDSARDLYEQALVIGSECHDRSVEAYLRDGLGAMYFIQDDPERALQEYGRVLQMYTQLNEPQGMGEVLIHMARALSDQSSHDSALHLSARALEIFTQLGDHKGKANVLFNRGRTYAAIGDPDTALQNFNLALELYIALEDRYNTAATLGNLAGIYADREQYEQAVRHYDRASELFAEL
ncbi:MAG: tetratricopeptide repeat protein, partial [candidate division Zixibacteria bacterium]|nr:tetratricopeptide repeat protein [candidate division Zixibacteria bacterium]